MTIMWPITTSIEFAVVLPVKFTINKPQTGQISRMGMASEAEILIVYSSWRSETIPQLKNVFHS